MSTSLDHAPSSSWRMDQILLALQGGAELTFALGGNAARLTFALDEPSRARVAAEWRMPVEKLPDVCGSFWVDAPEWPVSPAEAATLSGLPIETALAELIADVCGWPALPSETERLARRGGLK